VSDPDGRGSDHDDPFIDQPAIPEPFHDQPLEWGPEHVDSPTPPVIGHDTDTLPPDWDDEVDQGSPEIDAPLLDHLHPPTSSAPGAVAGPTWHLPDPFASPPDDVAVHQPFDTPPSDDHRAFDDALQSDYIGTWTAEGADHRAPVWDPATSALLANLTPQPGGGVDAALVGQPPEAADLWRDGLPEEPLPVDHNGQPLAPAALLDELIARIHDPVQADIARVVRDGLTT
jgi:hypothetical protein